MAKTISLTNTLINTLTELEQLEKSTNQKLSDLDKRLSDAHQDLENVNLNACQGYKVAKHIQEILQERRLVKNEHHCIQSAMASLDVTKIKNKAISMKQRVDSIYNRELSKAKLWGAFEDII
ncbi:hypothetical protein [Brevibacillus laterosporus]|uniref:hypothetical protein n=1 Tax=Brevibacillus laterosporus TaxID=1465 RepID=UPI002E20F0BE|nr:hypothetical protein [Brevibacillus laterosporus]MED1667290.1 hypothetical protein [Brevibacillus laterosporus]MED1718249.1 hypothetical protein [Brevibacillus laterosporus]